MVKKRPKGRPSIYEDNMVRHVVFVPEPWKEPLDDYGPQNLREVIKENVPGIKEEG